VTACKEMIEHSPFPMAATEGPAHSLRYVNSAFCAIHGKHVREILGHPIANAIPPSIADSILSLLDRVYLSTESGTVNSLRFSESEHGVVAQSYTAWAITDDHASGLVIQVGDLPRDSASADQLKDYANDEMRAINERLLIASLRHHELANAATEAHDVLSKAFERERAIATALQYAVLWEEPEDVFRGIGVAIIYEPALEEALVGGDFFDALTLPNGQVMFIIGDVTGKGLKAAARTVEVKYALRAFAENYEVLGDVVSRLNDYICRRHTETARDNGELIVLLVAVLDPADGAVRFICAGAEPPVIVRASGVIEEVPTHGLMLGIQPGIAYSQVDRSLETGDLLVLTTDGITESRRGLDFFGYERMAQIVQRADPSKSLHDMAKTVVDAARAHAGGKFQDDVCILLVRRK